MGGFFSSLIFIRCSSAARLANYPTIYQRPCTLPFFFVLLRFVLAPPRTSRPVSSLPFSPPCSYTLKTRGVHAQHQPSFYISIRSFRVFFLSIIPLSNPFFQSDSLHPSSSKCQSTRLLFSLSLSIFSPLQFSFSSFSVNDRTTVPGNTSIRS